VGYKFKDLTLELIVYSSSGAAFYSYLQNKKATLYL